MADPSNPSGIATTKLGYFAAGMGRESVATRVEQAERARTGLSSHPWPEELKDEMIEACNGALSQSEIDERISALRVAYEDKVLAAEKALRARGR